MKFISVFWTLIIIIKVIRAKNLLDIFLENRNINRDVSKASKPPYIFEKTRTIDLFPRLPHRETKFIVDLNPPKETYTRVTPHEQYKKALMRKLSIKDISYKHNIKVKAEVTTKRSLMSTKKFTVRPHDIYPELDREKYNWNTNRKKNYNLSILEKQYNPRRHATTGSRKSKTILPISKRNVTKSFEENPKKSFSKRLQINNFVSESEVPLTVVNNSNSKIIEEIENITVPPDVFIQSDAKDQIDVMMNNDDEEMTTDGDLEYLVPRPKRSVNVIEEESVATTFSGIKITNQEYSSHDLTFKNIHI